MYIEKRKVGESVKYYLIHSYRDGNRVEKIRKYLGSNLSEKELELKRVSAEKIILGLLKDINTDIFGFSLTKNQIEKLNNYNKKISIVHLTKQEWKRFTEEFVYNTNAIEGSTVMENEVQTILEKKTAEGNDEIETRGVARAVKYIQETKEDLSKELLLKLHLICFKDSKLFAGKFRDVNVVVRNSLGEILHTGVPKEQLDDYLDDLISWYHQNKSKFKPLVLAAIIHNQFEHIHPFQDGNGRVGRLLLNFILIKNKYPPVNILLEDRQQYYWTLQQYSREDNLKPTLEFLINQYNKTLKRVSTEK